MPVHGLLHGLVQRVGSQDQPGGEDQEEGHEQRPEGMALRREEAEEDGDQADEQEGEAEALHPGGEHQGLLRLFRQIQARHDEEQRGGQEAAQVPPLFHQQHGPQRPDGAEQQLFQIVLDPLLVDGVLVAVELEHMDVFPEEEKSADIVTEGQRPEGGVCHGHLPPKKESSTRNTKRGCSR